MARLALMLARHRRYRIAARACLHGFCFLGWMAAVVAGAAPLQRPVARHCFAGISGSRLAARHRVLPENGTRGNDRGETAVPSLRLAGAQPLHGDLTDRICSRLNEAESLRSICRDFGLPRHRTVLSLVAKRPDLCRRYDLARELAVHTVGDDASGVADGIWRRSSPTASEDARRCRRRVVVTEIAHQSTRARRAFAAIQVMRNSTARVPPRGSRLSACRT